MRLIDADALIGKFNEKVDMAECLVNARTAERFATFCALADAVEEMPTVDAVPVVRCKDCKYYKISELHPPYKFCFRLRHPTENRSVGYKFADDDFCSYGKRKEEPHDRLQKDL